MARCGCAGGTCSCVVQGVGPITVTGSGSANNPYIVEGAYIEGDVSETILTAVTGEGSVEDPFVVTAVLDASLDDLTDVNVSGATTGQVLAKQVSGQWQGVPATTAAVGAVNTACGLNGDGSSGNPLVVQVEPDGYIECVSPSGGIALTGAAQTVIEDVPGLQTQVAALQVDVDAITVPVTGDVPASASFNTFADYSPWTWRKTVDGTVMLTGLERWGGATVAVPRAALTMPITSALPVDLDPEANKTWQVMCNLTATSTVGGYIAGTSYDVVQRLIYREADRRLYLLAAETGSWQLRSGNWISLDGIQWWV